MARILRICAAVSVIVMFIDICMRHNQDATLVGVIALINISLANEVEAGRA